jgi:hypothetical protein
MPLPSIDHQLIRELVMLLAPEISRTSLAAVLGSLTKALGPIVAPIVLQYLIDALRDLYRDERLQ